MLSACSNTISSEKALKLSEEFMYENMRNFGCTENPIRVSENENRNNSFVWECVDSENEEHIRVWLQVENDGRITFQKEGNKFDGEASFELKLRP